MTWLGQVGHVIRKDLRHSRWLVIAFIAVVLFAVARAAVIPRFSSGAYDAAMFGIALLAGLIAAALVQTDSPTASNVFWASRPFHPSAMLAAKLVLIFVLIIVLPTVAEMAGLLTFDLPTGTAARLALNSAIDFIPWIFSAVIVASFTIDLRGFVLAYLGCVIAFLLAVTAFTSAFTLPFWGGPIFMDVLAVAGLVGGVAVLAYLYRRRDVHGRVRAMATVAASCAVVAAFGSVPPRPARKTAAIHSAIHLQLVDSGYLATRLDLRARLTIDDAPSGDQITFTTDSIVLHLRDGSVVRTSAGFQSTTLHAAALPLDSGWRWLNPAWSASSAPSETQGSASFGLALNDTARRALSRGLAGVELIGMVAVTEPYRLATMPLIAGRERTVSGLRVRIDGVMTSPDEALIGVNSVRADHQDSPLIELGTIVGPGYAIVNKDAREGVVLTKMQSHGGTDWIVFPGSTLREQSVQLQSNPSGVRGPAVARDDAWYRGADLVIFGWRSTDSYSSHLSARVPTSVP